MKDLMNLNDLYDILTERQQQVRNNEASICKEEGCTPDYIKGYRAALQYAKIMTACTEGFEL